MPLVSIGMDKEDIVWQVIVVIDNESDFALALSPLVASRQSVQSAYVKYTIDSRPLFFGTVSSAVGSSTA
jgi:hypothetical protein